MKSSVYNMIFNWEEYVFEIYYTFEKGMKGDGYLQPDDDDEIYIEKIELIAFFTEDGQELFCKNNPDVQHLLQHGVVDLINDAVWEDVESNEYHL
tara:strand:+ start:304 stop:588 length:285 start_codon:yes stop_codon:yes gene_type:complete